MAKKSLWIGWILLFVSCALQAQFYAKYGENQRKQLGEAYYLAGRQYQTAGETEKGQGFVDLAYKIWPSLNPKSIAEPKMLSAAELLSQGRATYLTAPGEVRKDQLPASYFLRFIGAFLDEDSARVAEFLDGSLYVTSLNRAVSRADAEASLEELFQTISLEGYRPSQIYNLDSIAIEPGTPAMEAQWGETYLLRVDAREDFSRQVSFWESRQQFTVRRVGSDWRIIGIGRTPPTTWSPLKAAAQPTRAPQAAAPAPTPEQSVREAFRALLVSLLSKNMDAARKNLFTEVRFLRLDQKLSRDEIVSSFLDAFRDKNLSGTSPEDLLDLPGAFVTKSDRFAGQAPGPQYLLSVQTKADLSESLPFWASYQDYYLAFEEGTWKVFAVF
jgi:hypothetical protein